VQARAAESLGALFKRAYIVVELFALIYGLIAAVSLVAGGAMMLRIERSAVGSFRFAAGQPARSIFRG
jgi:hypothetical protein